MAQYSAYINEDKMKFRFPICSEIAAKRIQTILVVQDCSQATFNRAIQQNFISLVRAASQIGSDYYPETLGLYLFLNTPYYFHFVWGITKNFIDEKSRRLFVLVPQNDTMRQLKELIHDCDIPAYLGGQCSCSDSTGYCITSNKGPW